jgi:hypothetical protein
MHLKNLLYALLFLCTVSVGAFAADVASISALRAMPASTAAAMSSAQVAGYYSAAAGCPVSYKWNPQDTSADNGGAVIAPAGSSGPGRWNALLPPGAVHTCVFGVKADNSTDNSAQLQAAMDWAHDRAGNWVWIDGGFNKSQCIKFGKTLIPREGEVISGDGTGSTAEYKANTCLVWTNNTGYMFRIQTPYPGFGNVPYEGPKFRDLTMYQGGSTKNPGGCIQLNSIAGGFTDTPASQQAIMHPQIRDVLCYMGYIAGNQSIGFQCSKCAEVDVYHTDFYNGATGVDLEGSENATIGGNCRITNTYGPMVKFVSHGTFGNKNRLEKCQLLFVANLGQTVASMVYSTARSTTVSDTFFEAAPPTGGSIGAQIHLAGGMEASLSNNSVTVASIPWLKVDGTYNNIIAIGNGTAGGLLGAPMFNGGKGATYFYNGSGLQQTLVHYGNGQNGDYGWPFNSQGPQSQILPVNTEKIFTPSFYGLSYAGLGMTESPISNAFNFPVAGAQNYLDFRGLIDSPPLDGVYDIAVRAYQADAANGQISCMVTSKGSPVGGTVSQAVTASPAWYILHTAQATSDAGLRCYNSGRPGLVMPEVQLVRH